MAISEKCMDAIFGVAQAAALLRITEHNCTEHHMKTACDNFSGIKKDLARFTDELKECMG
jgi:hypothetical protein